ncbi:MAG: tetratricopeptide repeat-containing sensor histidine kinase [Bacteroidia bacterium]|nr:tetratricopeptide repeat-containing sensor histidine kinase [Bacteroidia bacterium]
MTLKRLPPLYCLLFILTIFSKGVVAYSSDSAAKVVQNYIDNHKVDLAKSALIPIKKAFEKDIYSLDAWHYYHLQSQLFDGNEVYDSALIFIRNEINLSKKLKRNDLLIHSLLNMGSHYESLDDLAHALACYLEILDLYEEAYNETEMAYMYNKLGLIFFADYDYETAIKYFNASFVIFNKNKNEREVFAYWVQNTLTNIGLCYERLGKLYKAMFYFRLSLKFCETAKFDQHRPIGVIKTNIGALYANLGNYPLAISYMRQGIILCLDPKNYEIAHGVGSLMELAEIYSKTGNYYNADTCLSKALKLIEEKKFVSLWSYYYEAAYKNAERKKQFEKAFNYQTRFYQTRDSLNQSRDQVGYTKQILLHNLEKQKVENKLLAQNIELKTLQNRVVMGIVIFFFFISFFILYNLKKSGKRNTELELLNEQITEQKNTLQLLNLQLERTNQNKSYLIQTVAHDLRTPIGNIMSLGNLMAESISENEEFNEYVTLINHSSQSAITIIEDILDQSAIERGKLNLFLSPLHINDVILESIQTIKFRLEPKNISVKTNFQNNAVIQLDHDRFKRVMLNIISNAIKFSPRKSIIEINQIQQENSVLISIRDSGIGMDAHILSQIFEKNTVVGRAGLENEKTIGVGLSIAKTIIEGHKGKLWAESEPEKGSVFFIELPIERDGV